MEKVFKMQIITVMFFVMQAGAGNAGDAKSAYKNTYYGPNAFSRLAGDDGMLSEEDWINNRSAIETKYGADFRWNKAMGFDADGDGALSPSEARSYRNAEVKRLTHEWKKREKRFTVQDKKWLKNHPVVAEKLVQNHSYLENHPEVAKAIYSDRTWLNNHPDVAKKLYSNRVWLNNHPEVSKKLYSNRQWLDNHPEVAKGVYKNRQFLNDNPDIANKIYKNRQKLNNHPTATKKAYKAAKKHPGKAKRVYNAGKKHPNKAKRVYKVGEKRPGKVRKAARHPRDAKNRAKNYRK